MLLCAQVKVISCITTISGQSMEKMQKVSYKRAISPGNDSTTSILYLALPSEVFYKQLEPISILIIAAFRFNTARICSFSFYRSRAQEKKKKKIKA